MKDMPTNVKNGILESKMMGKDIPCNFQKKFDTLN